MTLEQPPRPIAFWALLDENGNDLIDRIPVYTLTAVVSAKITEPCTISTPALYDSILGGNRIDGEGYEWGNELLNLKIKRGDLPATINSYFNMHIIPPIKAIPNKKSWREKVKI